MSFTEAPLPLDQTDEATDPALDLFTASGRGGGRGVATGSPSLALLMAVPLLSCVDLPLLTLEEFLLQRELNAAGRAGRGSGENGPFDALSDGVMDLRMRGWYWLYGRARLTTESAGPGTGKSVGVGEETLSRMFRPPTGSGTSGWMAARCRGKGGRGGAARLPATGVGGLLARPVGCNAGTAGSGVSGDEAAGPYSFKIVSAG